MDDNYPSGTYALDPAAPWNQPDALVCPECGEDADALCADCGACAECCTDGDFAS